MSVILLEMRVTLLEKLHSDLKI